MIEAREISQVVRTADLCGYDLDEDRVGAFVSDRVAAMGPTARQVFQTSGRAHRSRLERMSAVERTASCALQERVARDFGLLRE